MNGSKGRAGVSRWPVRDWTQAIRIGLAATTVLLANVGHGVCTENGPPTPTVAVARATWDTGWFQT